MSTGARDIDTKAAREVEMTAMQRAKLLAYDEERFPVELIDQRLLDTIIGSIASALNAHADAAVQEEREACVHLSKVMGSEPIADAIKARTPTTPETSAPDPI